MTLRPITLGRPRRSGATAPTLQTTGVADTDALGAGGVFLRPGDWLFGHGPVRVSTLLGSCISIALWAPRMKVGAICHCLLPERPRPDRHAPLDGRYGSDAGEWMERQMRACGCPWSEVEASLAGGAGTGESAIGTANIRWVQQWAAERGLVLAQQDVGGRVVRRLTFNLADGSLTVAHGGRLGPAGE